MLWLFEAENMKSMIMTFFVICAFDWSVGRPPFFVAFAPCRDGRQSSSAGSNDELQNAYFTATAVASSAFAVAELRRHRRRLFVRFTKYAQQNRQQQQQRQQRQRLQQPQRRRRSQNDNVGRRRQRSTTASGAAVVIFVVKRRRRMFSPFRVIDRLVERSTANVAAAAVIVAAVAVAAVAAAAAAKHFNRIFGRIVVVVKNALVCS